MHQSVSTPKTQFVQNKDIALSTPVQQLTVT